MAIVEVKVPQLSESVAEATLMTWKKKPGEIVAMDEILIEVETDKVVLEVPAPAAGVMAELVESDGATVASEQVIARIDTDGAAAAAAPAAQAAPASQATAAVSAAATSAPAVASKDGVASPAAAKHMADNGMAPGSVAGTGKDGRVTKGDVLAAAAAPKAAVTSAVIPTGVPKAALPQVQTVAPSPSTNSAITPAAGAGTSNTTLSVSPSIKISSIATISPGFFFHVIKVASATDSDSWVTFTSTIAIFRFLEILGSPRPGTTGQSAACVIRYVM